jgi:2'-hydroxyisoflavone reductase
MATDRREFLRLAGAGALGFGLIPPGLACATGEPPDAAPRAMRILILGGTSFIGPHQVKYALERGHEVSIFNRGRTEPPFFHDLFERVEKLRGDRNDDLAALETGEWDAVLDNSASVPRWVRQSAGLLSERAGHYLFVSSISAYGDPSTVGLDEDSPVATIEDETIEEITGESYGPLKALSEQEAMKAFPGRATVVRPGLIVGPGDPTDRWTYWPVRVDRGGEVMAPGTPDDPVQVIDARDLSEFMIRLVEQGHAGTYNATGPATRMGMGPMLTETREALGADATFTWVDAEFLQEHEVQPWLHMPAWVPPEGEGGGLLQVSIARALEKGLTFRPLGETATDTVAWWNTLDEERQGRSRFGLPAEREVEVLAAWHARDAG